MAGRWRARRLIPGFGAALCLLWAAGGSSDEALPESQVKAAFLHKFLYFVDLPSDHLASGEPLVVGILGDDPFGDRLRQVVDRPVNGHRLLVRRLGRRASKDTLTACHVLFLSASLKARTKAILSAVAGHPVLTVGDAEDFVEEGGMIGFIRHRDRLRFEINRTAANRVGIRLRSRLLRLATRVVEEEP